MGLIVIYTEDENIKQVTDTIANCGVRTLVLSGHADGDRVLDEAAERYEHDGCATTPWENLEPARRAAYAMEMQQNIE